ncbi:MAG: (2Fe-2S)-binding protein [Treponema sp.]|jgi:carbon-monoxide dehydrogenase small subunit|nr:(2Fe-2S)-binding protein [Treponema sp.]
MVEVTFTLNGEERRWRGPAGERLLDALRNTYQFTGTKCGCGEGECGACGVIIDGRLCPSCLTAMGRLEGASVVTIEGYRETERFAALERAFAVFSAVQCGFCTPGMVLAAECLLSRKPRPTEGEIREALSGNLCRCTGYNAIVKAVALAAEDGAGLW